VRHLPHGTDARIQQHDFPSFLQGLVQVFRQHISSVFQRELRILGKRVQNKIFRWRGAPENWFFDGPASGTTAQKRGHGIDFIGLQDAVEGRHWRARPAIDDRKPQEFVGRKRQHRLVTQCCARTAFTIGAVTFRTLACVDIPSQVDIPLDRVKRQIERFETGLFLQPTC